MQRSALCRSRRELSNAYFLAKFGFDTAENEPCQVSRSEIIFGCCQTTGREACKHGAKFSGVTSGRAPGFLLEAFMATTPLTYPAVFARDGAAGAGAGLVSGRVLRSEVNSELNFPSNFEGLVLGCIDADFCK